MQIVDYYVAFGETHDEFSLRVLKRIQDGWVPIGGVSVVPLRIKQDGLLELELVQAMVKYADGS